MMSMALVAYVSLMSVTPGPNNLMLAASAVNFGLRRTLPHVLGISCGHGLQILLVSLCLGWVLAVLSVLRLPLAMAACVYLLGLSWQIWRAAPPESGECQQAMSFLGAAAFQWVNPKAWVMVINTAVLFLPENASVQDTIGLALVCALVNLPCILVWAVLGDVLRRCLAGASVRRIFNGVMASLLLGVCVLLMHDELRLYGVLS